MAVLATAIQSHDPRTHRREMDWMPATSAGMTLESGCADEQGPAVACGAGEEIRGGGGGGYRVLRRLSGAVPHPAGARGGVRALRQRERPAGARRPGAAHAAHAG